MNRRRLLAATAPAAMLLPGMAAGMAQARASHTDDVLIALCARYVAISRKGCDLCEQGADLLMGDPEEARLFEAQRALVPGQHALADQIAEHPGPHRGRATRQGGSGTAHHGW